MAQIGEVEVHLHSYSVDVADAFTNGDVVVLSVDDVEARGQRTWNWRSPLVRQIPDVDDGSATLDDLHLLQS